MKSFLTFLCAATLASASLAAQSAPAGDSQRVITELLRLAQERNAAGDMEMARALAEQASRMMGGQPAADSATPVLMALGGAADPMLLDRTVRADSALQGLILDLERRQAFLELAQLEGSQLLTLGEGNDLAALSGLGYVGGGDGAFTVVRGSELQEPGQDHLHASLMAIREELHALRAEVSALRAEIAAQRSGNMFWGGNVIPMPGGAMAPGAYQFHAPAQAGQQGQFYYLPQGGGPAAPAGAPQSSWQRYDSVPVQPSGAPNTGSAAPGGGAGAWQRHHAQAEAEAAAHSRDAHAAAQQAHAALTQALHGAAAGAGAPPPEGPRAAPPAGPTPPVPPAAPSTPRSSSRPHDVR